MIVIYNFQIMVDHFKTDGLEKSNCVQELTITT